MKKYKYKLVHWIIGIEAWAFLILIFPTIFSDHALYGKLLLADLFLMVITMTVSKKYEEQNTPEAPAQEIKNLGKSKFQQKLEEVQKQRSLNQKKNESSN